MNTASTADDAAVEAPNTSRNSRNQDTWKTSPHIPDRNSSPATGASAARCTGGAADGAAPCPWATARRRAIGDFAALFGDMSYM